MVYLAVAGEQVGPHLLAHLAEVGLQPSQRRIVEQFAAILRDEDQVYDHARNTVPPFPEPLLHVVQTKC